MLKLNSDNALGEPVMAEMAELIAEPFVPDLDYTSVGKW